MQVGAQIFFQPGEGGFKGGVVLPVGEIGDVIFLRTSFRIPRHGEQSHHRSGVCGKGEVILFFDVIDKAGRVFVQRNSRRLLKNFWLQFL
jgi:hypothetical protein